MKPLAPFPLPISIGTDICHVQRIYSIVSGARAQRFVNRILTREEQLWNASRLRGLQQQQQQQQQQQEKREWRVGGAQRDEVERRDPHVWAAAAFLAGRFAAKEAAIKAHSHRRLTFHDILIEARESRTGDNVLSGDRLGSGPKVARIRTEGEDDDDVSAVVSISHDGEYAMAACLGYDPAMEKDK